MWVKFPFSEVWFLKKIARTLKNPKKLFSLDNNWINKYIFNTEELFSGCALSRKPEVYKHVLHTHTEDPHVGCVKRNED